MVIVASATGFFVGVAAVWFKRLIGVVHDFFFFHVYQTEGDGWSIHLLWLPLLVGFGGLLAGILNHYFNPAEESAAASEAMKWVAVGSKVPSRIIWFRPLISALTLGSGGSGGKEGPIVQVGAAIGDFVGRKIKASSERRRLLMGCGSAAAIAAAFNAPLGGLIFAIEVIMGDFNIKVFSPLIFASVIATVTSRGMEGNIPTFELPEYSMVSTWEVIFFIMLGSICGLLAALFYKAYFKSYDIYSKIPIHPVLIPALGGVVVGFIGILFPDVLGNGYGSMNKVLTGSIGLGLAFLLIFVKMVATASTIGSHGSGGMFAPALFIGSMAGGVFGMALNYLCPSIVGPSGAYALVGMGAVMSAAANAPLTNILMAFELTNNYQIIIPIMLACISSSFVYSYFLPNSIYEENVRRVGVNIWGGREQSIMGAISVKEVMTEEFETIPENFSFKKILKLISNSRQFRFPVVDEKGLMTGILSVQDVRSFMFEVGLEDLVVAKELATEDVITLYADNTLNDAMEKFAIRDLDELPVVTKRSKREIIGVVKRVDVITAYKKAVLETSI